MLKVIWIKTAKSERLKCWMVFRVLKGFKVIKRTLLKSMDRLPIYRDLLDRFTFEYFFPTTPGLII